MTRYLGGFEVLVPAAQFAPGTCRCGACGATMSDTMQARETHKLACGELRRLIRMAERAVVGK